MRRSIGDAFALVGVILFVALMVSASIVVEQIEGGRK